MRAKVQFHGSYSERRKTPEFRHLTSFLTDDRGRKIILNQSPYFREANGYGYVPVPNGVKNDEYNFEYEIEDVLLPRDAKQVTFHALISANDSWPVEVTAVLRDGKKLPPSPLKVRSIQFINSPRYSNGFRVAIAIDLQGPMPATASSGPVIDWTQRLEIENGHQIFIYGAEAGDWRSSNDIGEQGWDVYYDVNPLRIRPVNLRPFNKWPKGRAMFKAQVKLPGFDWLPIEAIVPQSIFERPTVERPSETGP